MTSTENQQATTQVAQKKIETYWDILGPQIVGTATSCAVTGLNLGLTAALVAMDLKYTGKVTPGTLMVMPTLIAASGVMAYNGIQRLRRTMTQMRAPGASNDGP